MKQSSSSKFPRVLIVDDDPGILAVLMEILGRTSVEVTQAASGLDALERLDEERFELLITDLDMPGLSGVELISKAKLLAPTMPVLVVTGSQRGRLTGGSGDLEVAGWFPKPFDPLRILDRVEDLLDLL